MIDTSVWVECQEDSAFGKSMEKIASRHEILGCPTIDLEVQNAIEFLKASKMPYEELKRIYDLHRRDVDVNMIEVATKLTDEYIREGVRIGLPLKGMKTDISIVAFASIQKADRIASLNRKSMASDYARFVYDTVNAKNGLKVLSFIIDKSLIMKLSEI